MAGTPYERAVLGPTRSGKLKIPFKRGDSWIKRSGLRSRLLNGGLTSDAVDALLDVLGREADIRQKAEYENYTAIERYINSLTTAPSDIPTLPWVRIATSALAGSGAFSTGYPVLDQTNYEASCDPDGTDYFQFNGSSRQFTALIAGWICLNAWVIMDNLTGADTYTIKVKQPGTTTRHGIRHYVVAAENIREEESITDFFWAEVGETFGIEMGAPNTGDPFGVGAAINIDFRLTYLSTGTECVTSGT